MTGNEFCEKWRNAINASGQPAVGIHVNWEQISENSLVTQLLGKEAWERIYEFTPPWFKTPKTFRDLIDSRDSDCLQIVKEESENGRLEHFRKNGMTATSFCAFSNRNQSFVLLGDGNHRFSDCAYLIDVEKHEFSEDLEKINLDIICLENFDQVIEPNKIWSTWNR